MKSNIVILFGASGSGKSTFITELRKNSVFSIHQKGTTRDIRQYDGQELVHVDEDKIKLYDYRYSRYGFQYGLQKKQIDIAITENKIHVAICNDVDVIEKIKNDYPEFVKVVYLLFDAPKEIIEEIQRKKGIADDEINLRLEKIDVLNDVFVRHSFIFDGVIINKYGSRSKLMVNQLISILKDSTNADNLIDNEVISTIYNIAQDVSQLKKHILPRDLEINIQKNYVFVIMAMDEKNPRIREILGAIKRAAKSLGMNAERVDEIVHNKSITETMLHSIKVAEFVVADITFEKQNCYYEIGYAHAFGKNTILVAEKGTKIHFDVQSLPIGFYDSTEQLEEMLISKMSKMR